MSDTDSFSIILYDGVCGLCNRLNQFLLKRDRHDRFRFASLQSNFAKELLERHAIDALDLDTVHVVIDYGKPGEKVLSRSDAIIHALSQIGSVWGVFAAGKVLPRSLRDSLYKLVATNRYRLFGKYDVCLMPEERFKHKFLE
jgi:predicted DCC family thiol-disulfide oxidoreductase YuxK